MTNKGKGKKRWRDGWKGIPLDGTIVWGISSLPPLSVFSSSPPFSRSLFLSHVVSSSPTSSSLFPSFYPPNPNHHLSVCSMCDGGSYTAGNWTHRTVVFPESKLGAWDTQKAFPRTVSVCLIDFHQHTHACTHTGARIHAYKFVRT